MFFSDDEQLFSSLFSSSFPTFLLNQTVVQNFSWFLDKDYKLKKQMCGGGGVVCLTSCGLTGPLWNFLRWGRDFRKAT